MRSLVISLFSRDLLVNYIRYVFTVLNPLSRISHLSGSHASLTHAIAYNPIAKRLAKKFKYHFTHH